MSWLPAEVLDAGVSNVDVQGAALKSHAVRRGKIKYTDVLRSRYMELCMIQWK